MELISKMWGSEEVVTNTEHYCFKYLHLSSNGCSSLHYHQFKDETFMVHTGKVNVQIGQEVVLLEPGELIRIKPGTHHRFWSGERGQGAVIIEVSTHHDDSDVVRIESSRLLPL